MVLSMVTNLVSSLVMNVATAPTWVIGLLVVGAGVLFMSSGGGLPTGGLSGSSGSSGGDESGGGA